MGFFENLLSKELSEDQKRIAKLSIPAFIGVLSGAVTVMSYLGSVIFTQIEADSLIKQVSEQKVYSEKTREEIFKRLDMLEERLLSGGDVNNKELLSRIQAIDNNMNRRIDFLYEKLIERKR